MHITDAKILLDKIISKSRTDMYKPIQIAEVLYQARQGIAAIAIHMIPLPIAISPSSGVMWSQSG